MSEWFSEWFDSEYYHILYKDRDFSEAEKFISNITSFLNLPKETKTLDLACGKGRHSIFLNSLGFNVTGLDLAAHSIQEASKHKSDTLQFGVHDMREQIPHAPFQFILNAFTSFGYFNNPEDDIKTLTNIYNALTKEGHFVFDFLNAHQVISNLVASEVKTVEGIDFYINRFIKDKSIFKNIAFKAEGRQLQFQERVDALTLEDFESYFETVGFKIKKIFGNYDLEEFNKQTSKRLIILATKN